MAGTLSATILLCARSESLVVRTWRASVTGLPIIWKVCSEVVALFANATTKPVEEAARHSTPPPVKHREVTTRARE